MAEPCATCEPESFRSKLIPYQKCVQSCVLDLLQILVLCGALWYVCCKWLNDKTNHFPTIRRDTTSCVPPQSRPSYQQHTWYCPVKYHSPFLRDLSPRTVLEFNKVYYILIHLINTLDRTQSGWKILLTARYLLLYILEPKWTFVCLSRDGYTTNTTRYWP